MVTAQKLQQSETTQELIGVLTAISIVSKRLAKKLELLEESPMQERSDQHGIPHKATG